MENFAVIDLGSNSARMTITQIDNDGTYSTVTQMKEYVRLSENMGPEKVLQPEAIERTLKALQSFKDVYSKLENVHLKAVATAATRQATNQKKFLKQVENLLGIKLEVLPGTMEAYYDYLGVSETLPATNAVILDTGGASSEIILVQNGAMSHLISIPIGSVNLTQSYLPDDVIPAADLFKAMTFVNDVYNNIWWLRNGLNLPVIGLGGSNRTMAKINRRFNNLLDFENVHGYRLSRHSVDDTFARIVANDLAARKAIPGLSKDRADIIVGGLIPLTLLMRYLDSDHITFSNSGLREGILFEHLKEQRIQNVHAKSNLSFDD
ncbi:exopolyphosphatase [Secundilactobacillus odoratitofui DSM 19909 = JCM 15043]|uniref:Exopolyphosphatase n=1 Tax=Secundilactobacillus odoratitofui DSM 19909 = JCM 15043 TaxID=1423776 RepID=A0A0R1LV24_9LACO|nr:Ppx/GppA family phosphatase [Secundilactobacillus odoratitofui]KRK99487.1 exopolyphosphatase [Secundilactobacillus odoratitofui DSM 19909 = JCM 15043]